MNANQYDKQKNALYNKFGALKTDRSHEVKISTKYGIMYISSEWFPKIKVASIHSRLDGNIIGFKNDSGYNINDYNGKCNFYFSKTEDALNELEEYLDNLNFLN